MRGVGIDGILDDWSPCRNSLGMYCIVGIVTGDRKDRFRGGELITTSRIRTLPDDLAEGVVVETLNSRYRLGQRAVQITLDAFLYAASVGTKVIGPDEACVGSG